MAEPQDGHISHERTLTTTEVHYNNNTPLSQHMEQAKRGSGTLPQAILASRVFRLPQQRIATYDLWTANHVVHHVWQR